MALRGNISTPVRVTDLIKASKDAASLSSMHSLDCYIAMQSQFIT